MIFWDEEFSTRPTSLYFGNGNLVVALRVHVYENVSMSNDVISEQGSTRPDRAIANYRRHRRRHHRPPRNDNQSRSDFRINLVIRAHASRLRSRKPRVQRVPIGE